MFLTVAYFYGQPGGLTVKGAAITFFLIQVLVIPEADFVSVQSLPRSLRLFEKHMTPIRANFEIEASIVHYRFPSAGIVAQQIDPDAILRKGNVHLLISV